MNIFLKNIVLSISPKNENMKIVRSYPPKYTFNSKFVYYCYFYYIINNKLK